MKRLLTLLMATLLAPLTALPASMGYYKTMDEAKAAATSKASIVVLHHGSGWNETGRFLKNVWLSKSFQKNISGILQLEDLPTSVTELSPEDRKKLEAESERTGKGMDRLIGEFLNKGKTSNFKQIKNYPALSLYDNLGNFVASTEGLSRMSPRQFIGEIEKLKKIREKRDFFLKKAEFSSGLQKANFLAQAIRCVTDFVPEDDRTRHRNQYLEYIYKEFDQLATLDPQDKLGYQRALRIDPFSFIYHHKNYFDFGEKKLKGKYELENTLNIITNELKDPRNKVMTPEELQALYVVKYNVLRHLENKEMAEKIALEGAALAPTTILGQGLAGKYIINYGPATIRNGWKERHSDGNKWTFGQTPVLEQLMDYFPKPGHYEVSFTCRNRSISIQGLTLKVNGKTIANLAENKQINRWETATFILPVSQVSKNMILEVTYSSDGASHGQISIRPYKKQNDLSDIASEFNF